MRRCRAGVRGAIGARDGVDGYGDVEEADALGQLDHGGDCGVALRDAGDGGGEASQEREGVALAGVDEAVIAGRGRAARGGGGGGASCGASGARADDGVAGRSFLRNFLDLG